MRRTGGEEIDRARERQRAVSMTDEGRFTARADDRARPAPTSVPLAARRQAALSIVTENFRKGSLRTPVPEAIAPQSPTKRSASIGPRSARAFEVPVPRARGEAAGRRGVARPGRGCTGKGRSSADKFRLRRADAGRIALEVSRPLGGRGLCQRQSFVSQYDGVARWQPAVLRVRVARVLLAFVWCSPRGRPGDDRGRAGHRHRSGHGDPHRHRPGARRRSDPGARSGGHDAGADGTGAPERCRRGRPADPTPPEPPSPVVDPAPAPAGETSPVNEVPPTAVDDPGSPLDQTPPPAADPTPSPPADPGPAPVDPPPVLVLDQTPPPPPVDPAPAPSSSPHRHR